MSTGINEDSNSELANFSAFESSDEVLFLKFSSSALARSESSLAASNWDNTSSYEKYLIRSPHYFEFSSSKGSLSFVMT